MNESSYKKVIVYGIIVLFIGAGIVPSISGNTEKTSVQLTREAPIGSPLDDDYVNAYWKFNECYGTTLGDSSGHNYNGIINGATWTTSGHSGCALVFDGVDDYVDLEAHSKALGMNKTDDLIFTFWVKTTGSGIIYSATGYKNIPELKIEVVSNGSIMFRVWTALCGILVYSAPGHDDGEWHQVEIIFNGITSDPTVEISVDTNLEGTKTKWLCDIANDEFLDCKFGRRASDESGAFSGVVDDFKIIKYEQGNKQNPPTIDGPDYGKPGIVYDYTFVTNDPEGDTLEAITIDWDDGIQRVEGPFESGEAVLVSHKWTEDGSYDVSARSEDFWHYSPWSDPYNVKIGNQAPSPPDITGPKYGNAQEQLTYTFVSEDYEGENIRYFIDWDDGTTTETGYHASGEEITETHSWGANKDYYIKARGEDNEGKKGEWSTYHIRIGDQPPNKPSIFGSVQGVPKIKYQFAFSSIDPENDNISYDIDWGDGNQESYGPFSSGKTLSLSHSWATSDTYTVKAQAKDIFDNPSGWSEHQIVIPRNKAYNIYILELLFERFPRAFLTFRYFLGL